MTYDEFLSFLDNYIKLPSFAQKIKYANDNLTRIGSGSGRIVYDIDGLKVFKIAKNTKGVAQNEVEINTASYYDTRDIVTEVIESDEENSTWIVAEKGKKVNEKRIVELTGISSLNSLYYYLRNVESLRDGGRNIFGLDKSEREMLDENEFATELRDFIANSSQKAGDLGRPSSYGEVVRNGVPTIVLTDYGLDTDVYSTHYDRNPKRRMYELFGELGGNDDILSDIGNVGNEVQHGMWAIQPYSVSDGDSVINERAVSFVENRKTYPKTAINNIGELSDIFHECVNNLDLGIKKAKNKKNYYSNLINLQEYLISQKYYDREPLPILNEEKVDRNSSNRVANAVAEKYGYGKPTYIASGGYGYAYDIGNNMVLKVTTDKTEAIENLEMLDKQLEYIAKPYAVYSVDSNKIPMQVWVIILEKVRTDYEYFRRISSRLDYAMRIIFKNIYRGSIGEVLIQIANQELTNDDYAKIDKYMKNNPEDAKFYNGMINIINEIRKYGIESQDFTNLKNLGYKQNGNLAFFDVGYGNPYTKSEIEPEVINVNEDGTTLYSTDSGNGDTGEPTFANGYYGEETKLNAELDSKMVNEEFLGRMDFSDDDDEDIEVFKNPKSISRLKPDIRGIVTNSGDFYLVNAISMIHHVIAKWLNNTHSTNLPVEFRQQYAPDYKVIPVQRYKNTNRFYLGELYDTRQIDRDAEKIKSIFNMAKTRNPTIEFVVQSVEEARDTIKEPELTSAMYEREMKWMNGTSSVVVKDKCRLGGGTACNQGDINNLQINRMSENLNEEIDASEAHTNLETISSVINGKKNVGTVVTFDNEFLINYIEKARLGIIPIKQTDNNVGMIIIYNENGVNDAKKLEEYMKSRGGYTSDDTPEEARYIGKLLGYTNSSIEEYVARRYGKSVANDENNRTFANENQEIVNEVEIMNLNDLPFKNEIESMGGKIYSVGGAVRDGYLGKESKDLDVLITGVPMDSLEQLLNKYGEVNAVGKSFGVIKFKPKGSTEDIDIAIPRTETQTDAGGHKGFDVKSDHTLPIEKDLERRDFTINAIAKDNNGNIIDPFNGREDLQNKIIRAVNPRAFQEDPLRMLRGIQFATRFGFTIEPETMNMIKQSAEKIKTISPERILIEFDKIIKKGDILMGVELLVETGIFTQIFGRNIEPSRIERRDFPGVKTMGEFIFLMSYGVVDNPSNFFIENLKGDNDSYNEIRALEIAFNSDLLNSNMPKLASRSIAHNMYLVSPQSLNSQIIPEQIEMAAKDLLSGAYPKTVNELAINGNDIMRAGLQGKEIGNMQKSLLMKIYDNKVRNNREELSALLPQTNVNEELIPYSDDYIEDDYDIDMDAAYERAIEIAKDNGINILSDKELAAVTTNNNGEVIGAIFESVNDREYSFDVVIDKNYQRMGYGKELIGFGIEQYNQYKDIYGAKLKLNLDVVNPNMQALLKKYFNFRTTKKTGNDRVNMTLRPNEGVADKYAEKKFGIPDTDRIANDKYNKHIRQSQIVDEEPVAFVDNIQDYPIFLNPKSLDNYESNVRAITDDNGNIYVSLIDGGFVHGTMAKAIGINDIYMNKDKYLLLHRVNYSNRFGLSDSNYGYMYSDNGKENIAHLMDLAVKRNPQFEFIPEYHAHLLESFKIKKSALNEQHKKSKYKNTKDSLSKSKNISADMKELISKYLTSGTRYHEGGKLYGLNKPDILKEKSSNAEGVSMGADKNGFFVYTHRARSKSHPTPEQITKTEINFIESTG